MSHGFMQTNAWQFELWIPREEVLKCAFYRKGNCDCQEVEMICPDQALGSARAKARLELKPPSSGPFLLNTVFFFFFSMNILATWLYFHGQFLKEIRNDLFFPLVILR